MSQGYDYYLRFLLMGNNYMGKSSLLRRYVEHIYDDSYFFFPEDFVRKKNIN